MKRQISAVAAGTLVALAAAVYALAGHGEGPVPSFTGCIKAGKLVKLDPGDEPKSPCIGSEVEAHLSGGDVTSVLAGAGLIGGGTEGAVALRADPAVVQSRVTGRCVNLPGIADQSINRINEDGTVDCNEDGGFVGYRRVVAVSETDSSSPKVAIAECPAAGRIVGGGADVPLNGILDIRKSAPSQNPERWFAMAAEESPTTQNWAVTVTAICAVVD